jgi:alkylation response protein AidB-like acyl-CoA dehydrogenase
VDRGSPPSVLAASKPHPSYPARAAALPDLMKALFDEGFGRYGWPRAFGGLGGTIFHRAATWDCLARHHVPGMGLFEHAEIHMPTRCALAPRAFMTAALPRFLAGRERWAQGFSEPDADSDLASLRARATRADGGYRIRGRNIWTSCAVYDGYGTERSGPRRAKESRTLSRMEIQ